MSLMNVARRAVNIFGMDVVRTVPADFSDNDRELLAAVGPYTMTSPQRVIAAVNAARYVADADIPGAVVECGVWRGGSSMAMALGLLERRAGDRDLYLFDTFEGMTAPTAVDRDKDGRSAQRRFQRSRTAEDRAAWCVADIDDVRVNLARTGYDQRRVHLVKGKVEDTLPAAAPDRIALLRLDTDWYRSTRHELETLYPRLASGGVLIVDDYGHWEGSRKAVDEYLAENDIPLLLHRIDYSGRVAIKP